MFAIMTILLLCLSILGFESNRTIEEYANRDFNVRQASRAVSQIRSHIAKSGWSCELAINAQSEKYLEDCYLALDASYAQVSSGVLKDSAPELEGRINKIYGLTEEVYSKKKKDINQKNNLYYESSELFNKIGLLESEYWQQTSKNYAELSIVIKQRSIISTYVIISIFFVLVYWVYLLLKQDADQKKLEEARETLESQRIMLIQSGKMSTLGEMAAGIAHEINNPLTIIEGKASQIKKAIITMPSPDERLMPAIEKISKMTDRISTIIRGLRNFARDGERDPLENKKVNSIIEETLDLCETRLKNHNVQIIYSPNEADYIISCRPTQISQVLLNLIHNANDAMNELEEKWIKISVNQVGPDVVISVEDAGLGISKEMEEKIFNPFFTTKEAGKGTGLGLSISRGIIEEHDGKIYVDHKNKNTMFRIHLPAAG